MANRNRFVKNWAQASKELRTGKKAATRKKTPREKEEEARRTGFLIGALKELFKK
ncbi:hypothetical protein [Candidatus Enterococcus clewellii]|nr:hypothetical protein [Enterococcus sp. 9E7_DIV0242]